MIYLIFILHNIFGSIFKSQRSSFYDSIFQNTIKILINNGVFIRTYKRY